MGNLKLMGATPDLVRYLREKIRMVEDRMENDGKELSLLNRLFHRLNPCVECGGYGEIANHIDQDTTRFENCEKCNGTGKAS